MRDTAVGARVSLITGFLVGGAVGLATGVLIDSSSGFWLWGGALWAAIGAASVTAGAAVGVGVTITASRSLAPVVVRVVACMSSAVISGLVASVLLTATSSVVTRNGSLLFSLTSGAVSLFLATRPRRHLS